MSEKRVGIMGAMREEVHEILAMLHKSQPKEIAGRIFHEGKLQGIDVVVVFSRWGKVAAASTATTLIREFDITELIFTGVAGAISPELNIGDVVIGKKFYQHDMDARPLMRQFEIPLLDRTYFESSEAYTNFINQKLNSLFTSTGAIVNYLKCDLESFGIQAPRLHLGDIASGDQFVASKAYRERIRNLLPEVICVEMEGAAVAQVCHENQVPFVIIRTISDHAENSAPHDFNAFIQQVAGKYAALIVPALVCS